MKGREVSWKHLSAKSMKQTRCVEVREGAVLYFKPAASGDLG
jgi:hypothetical protein